MADKKKHPPAPGGKPSQAEGDRETIERSLGERGEQRDTTRQRASDSPPGKPSQAEGDRETVEEDLREKGSR